MSIGIKVTPEQLQTLSGQLNRGSGDIAQQLASLAGMVSPLTSGDWAGQAQQRFVELWGQWQRSATGLREALDGIAALMASAGASYAAAEQSIAASFQA